MALKSQISRYTLQTSGDLNKKTKSFLGEDCLLSAVAVTSETPGSVVIGDFSMSIDGLLAYVESIDYTFDTSLYTSPYYLYMRNQYPYNDPFYVAYSYDSSTSDMTAYDAGENIGDSASRIEGTGSVSFDKNTSSDEAGVQLGLSIDISSYDGMGAKVKIPTGDSTNILAISIIIDESGSMTNYTRYDMTSGIVDGWNTLIGKFNNPDSGSGSNTFQYSVDTYILVKTDGTMALTGVLIDNLFGYYDDPNRKTYDDAIEIYSSDDTAGDFLLATYDSGSWSWRSSVSIAESSNIIFSHIDNTSVHTPAIFMDIITKSALLPSNTIITMTDATGATTDYNASHESSLKPISRTVTDPRVGTLAPYDSRYLKAEYLRKNVYSDHENGVAGYISDSSSTASLGYGCYFGGVSSTKVITHEFLDIPGNVNEIIVDVPSLKNDSLGEITYDLNVNDILIDTNLPLNVAYDTSGIYALHSMSGTKMKIEFNIPSGTGGDYWTVKNTHPIASKANRIISVADRFMLAAVNDSLYNYVSGSDSWRQLTSSTNSIPHTNPHPASLIGGLRSIPTQAASGESYHIASDIWSTISNGSAPDGRSVDIGLNEFYNIDSTATTRFIDSANCYLTKTGRAEDWVAGGAFVGHDGEMHTHGGSLTSSYTPLLKSYAFKTDVWASGATSTTNQAYQAYSQLSTKRLHSICGMSDALTYVKINKEYDEPTQAWSSKQDNSVELKSPGAGLTQSDTVLMMGGELSTSVDSDGVYEYTPDIVCKFFGFAVKLRYDTLFGSADHVGYWTDDTAAHFTEADSTEKDISGYWTNDSGLIGDGTGTYWGHYGYWADSSAADYDATALSLYEISTTGYWCDSSGLLDGDTGCLWNDEDY